MYLHTKDGSAHTTKSAIQAKIVKPFVRPLNSFESTMAMTLYIDTSNNIIAQYKIMYRETQKITCGNNETKCRKHQKKRDMNECKRKQRKIAEQIVVAQVVWRAKFPLFKWIASLANVVLDFKKSCHKQQAYKWENPTKTTTEWHENEDRRRQGNETRCWWIYINKITFTNARTHTLKHKTDIALVTAISCLRIKWTTIYFRTEKHKHKTILNSFDMQPMSTDFS